MRPSSERTRPEREAVGDWAGRMSGQIKDASVEWTMGCFTVPPETLNRAMCACNSTVDGGSAIGYPAFGAEFGQVLCRLHLATCGDCIRPGKVAARSY